MAPYSGPAPFGFLGGRCKWLKRFWMLLILGASLSGSALAANDAKAWAYFAWWLPQSWRTAPLGDIERLLFFELKVGPQGSIADRNGWPEKWGDLRAALSKSGTPLDLTLTVLNEKDFQSVFSSHVATRQLLDQAVDLARDPSVAGLHLDFEVYGHIPNPVISRFGQFVSDLSKALRAQKPSKNLSVFLPIGGESPIYDSRSVALLDHVVAQGYDAHWSSSSNLGPVAPLDGPSQITWKKAVAQSLALGVKRNKLLLSYPLYGYEWPAQDRSPRGLARGEGVTTTYAPVDMRYLPAIQTNVQDRVKDYGSTNDGLSGSSYYQFQKNSLWTTGWYEGLWAMEQKSKFLQSQKLGGMAFFLLGYDDGKLLEYFIQRRAATRECAGTCPVKLPGRPAKAL
jgi:spore germination protein